ncbi:hypothetical protein [Prevotella intermedia]|uniref:hypothetical protein n=1 Tax=Prevotella intermedia TaxID=28131 RepID=UPI0013A6B65C|nr:hypothetical protein [Prevotella intermedia]
MRKRKEGISKRKVSIFPLSLYKKLSSADWNHDIQNHNLTVYRYSIGQIMIAIRSVGTLLCLQIRYVLARFVMRADRFRH